MSSNPNATKRIKVSVSEDRLQAWVELLGVSSQAFTPPEEAEIVEALQVARIAVTDEVRERLQTIVAACAAAKAGTATEPLAARHLVAEGRPAVNAEDGRFEWTPELKARLETTDEHGRIDYFSLNAIVTVDAGTVIGRVVPPTEGQSSIDVHGEERPPRRPTGLPFKLGPGVRADSADPQAVVAELAGRVLLKRGKVTVCEVLEIHGDVDFNSGSVDACVDVSVRGTVRSNFYVRTTKSLSVDRVIEAADVQVEGGVTVRGGVFGQDGAGRILAGGDVTAMLLNEVRVVSGGSIRVVKEILNSRVRCMGKLIAEHGTIIGGEVYAREGVAVRVLGSEASVSTPIATGIDVNTLRRVRKLEKRVRDAQKSADQMRQAVQPLVANLKRLSPTQRERATELLSKADEMELQVEDLAAEAKRMLEEGTPENRAFIMANDAIHAGVQLAIDARIYRVPKLIHGPVKIELRKVEDATEMVAVNQRTGSVTVLHSGEADLDAPPDDEDAQDEARGVQQDGSAEQAARNKA